MGTPALPTAHSVAIKIQPIIEKIEKLTPFDVATKSTVIKIKAAQPFMLITEHRGKASRDNDGLILSSSSASSMVKGNVDAEDFEKKAVINAGDMLLAILIGESLLAFKSHGRTMHP